MLNLQHILRISELAAIKIRKERKQQLVEYKGGKCQICGYDKYIEALEFHHINPEEKDFNIAQNGYFDLEENKKEADKCILVCRNCHGEIHFL